MILIKKISRQTGIILGIFIVVSISIMVFWHHHSSKELENDMVNTRQAYSDGRKTIISFGNKKRFAIEKGIWEKEITWCLFDREKNGIEGTLDYIECYEQVQPYVYTKGKKGYTKLNYEIAEFIQSEDINEFSNEDREIFENLRQTKH